MEQFTPPSLSPPPKIIILKIYKSEIGIRKKWSNKELYIFLYKKTKELNP